MADITFLMNVDRPGSTNTFYGLAKTFFTQAGSKIIDAPAKGQTIEGVFEELKKAKDPPGTINLVSHASQFAAIQGAITIADRDKGQTFISTEDLENARKAKTPQPPPGIITPKTRVVIYGCDVGRSLNYLKLLAGLFGFPGELLAPKRLSVFMLAGSTAKYRQAQSWTLVRKGPLIPAGATVPTGGWDAFRKQFVQDASDKFGRAAILADPLGSANLDKILAETAKDATTAIRPTFFLEEGFDLTFAQPQTLATVASKIKPMANGDPVTAAPQSAAQVDDTTVVTTISGADAHSTNADNKHFEISLVVLGRIIDQDVPIAEGPAYGRVVCCPGIAPPAAPGAGSGSGSGSGSGANAANDEVQAIAAELLALGATQQDVDEFIASAPQGDATEGIATTSADEVFSVGDLDYPLPRLEPVS